MIARRAMALVVALLAACDSGTPIVADADSDADTDVDVDVDADADSDVDTDVDADADADADAGSRAWSFDLDGDGANDSDLAIASCAAEPGATCLAVGSEVVSAREVRLGAGADGCAGTVHGDRLRTIGDHAGDALQEVAVAWCPGDGSNGTPLLAIVDVAAAAVIGSTAAPADHANVWVDAAADPAGRLHPFLAPSYGDGDRSGYYGSTVWGVLCVFRPDLAPDARCGGSGFAGASAAPAESFFREVGGTVQDLDGDGWEDVTLIYHSTAHTVSSATLGVLATTVYDVALSTEPASPPLFHSGRNYGTHAAVTGRDGLLRTVIAGGAPVGSFTDSNCNVTRFVAVLETPPGNPAARRLAWSSYFGFASTIFSVIDPAYAADPSGVVARPADVMDGCIHRFGDSRAVMDGEDVVVFNYFVQAAPVDLCLDEQYRLYLPGGWEDPAIADAWYDCFATNVGASGVWGMQARAEVDGSSRTGSLNTYVWGRATTLRPGGETLYLVELLPGPGQWDLADRAPSPLAVYALVAGLWTDRGVFPVAGRPMIRHEPARGARGVASYTTFEELTLDDVDGDGFDDVQLADGTWVGWSGAASAFVVR